MRLNRKEIQGPRLHIDRSGLGLPARRSSTSLLLLGRVMIVPPEPAKKSPIWIVGNAEVGEEDCQDILCELLLVCAFQRLLLSAFFLDCSSSLIPYMRRSHKYMPSITQLGPSSVFDRALRGVIAAYILQAHTTINSAYDDRLFQTALFPCFCSSFSQYAQLVQTTHM